MQHTFNFRVRVMDVNMFVQIVYTNRPPYTPTYTPYSGPRGMVCTVYPVDKVHGPAPAPVGQAPRRVARTVNHAFLRRVVTSKRVTTKTPGAVLESEKQHSSVQCIHRNKRAM